ncbi:hypothetical protein BVX98_05670 [bacterium F11]|nr:hypothetical protein BVX98_05670 [bacterium F11]
MDHYLHIMKEENLHVLEIADGSSQVRLVRPTADVSDEGQLQTRKVHHQKKSQNQAPLPPKKEEGESFNSPIAGIFYRSPSPTAAPFVSAGDTIKSGQVLCIIEAMKVMNEITAESSGRVTKILVENGKPVEAGQAIFAIEPLH